MKEYFPKNELFEKLAAIEHERWVDWQSYCLKRVSEEIGIDTIGDKRWDKLTGIWYSQMVSFDELCEEDKDKDREQVMRYWYLINN